MLVALTSAIAVGVAVWIGRERSRIDQAALGMVLGGALGNILDRVRHGYVVDFADLHFGDFRPFLVFNVGDAAISIAVVVLLLRAFLTRKDHSKAETPRRLSNMRKVLTAVMLVAAAATSGCAAFKSHSRTPDEFAVARSAPLIVPPTSASRRPSRAPPAFAGRRPAQAIDALFGGPAPRSNAETSLLDQAGRDTAQIGIRSTAWDPDTRIVDKGPTT